MKTYFRQFVGIIRVRPLLQPISVDSYMQHVDFLKGLASLGLESSSKNLDMARINTALTYRSSEANKVILKVEPAEAHKGLVARAVQQLDLFINLLVAILPIDQSMS